MRGMIAAGLAATALLLGGCKGQDMVDDNLAAPLSDDSQNFGGPISVEDNMVGAAPGNTTGEPAVDEATGNDVAANESDSPDR